MCSLRGGGCGPHRDWVVVERPVSEDVQPSFLHYNLSLPGLVPGEVVFAGTPGRQHAEENLVKGRMDSLQQSFRSPAGPPVPNGWVPSGGGGQPSREFSNGHHFSEGADHRDKTTVTRGP